MKNSVYLTVLGVVCLLGLQSGCAFAPISNSYSGRTVGKGNIGLDGGVVAAGTVIPAVKVTVGVLDSLDIGLQYETFSMGGFLKFSLIQPQKDKNGFSLGLVGAGGTVASGYYAYGSANLGVKLGSFEPFGCVRYNWVKYKEDSSSTIVVLDGSYSYLSFSAGAIFWLGNHFGLVGEATFFSGTTGTSVSGTVFDGGILIRF